MTALAGSTEADQFAQMKPQVHPKNGPDAASQPILGEYPSISTIQLQVAEPGPEESLMPSGD